MVTFDPNSQRQNSLGIDRVKLRLLLLGIIVVAAFVALFSRLWFLQVLAADDFLDQAKANRVRKLQSEPPRGRILDRNGIVLVENRKSLSVTVDRQVVTSPAKERKLLARLSTLLDVPEADLRKRLHAPTVSPYKPVAIANDVPEDKAIVIRENQEDFPGVDYEKLPVRKYPEGPVAAQVLGYVNEISPEELKSDFSKGARPVYQPGDIVGKEGVERSHDRILRGQPGIEKVIVNSVGDVVEPAREVQAEEPGKDLLLTIDVELQRLVEEALANGLEAARGAGFEAPAGGAVVMDPNTGDILAMSSLPTYDPAILADGITEKEYASLGAGTPENPDDDSFLNRVIQGGFPPGSTFKVVTAVAALASGIADTSTYLGCPGAQVYPPEGGPGSVSFPNWTSSDLGSMGFVEALEISCNTFFYELGWQMETAFGPPQQGEDSDQFQRFARMMGFDHDTGIDLPNEFDGTIPDDEWCRDNADIGYCPEGWLPGFTVNMSIGQGEVRVSPLQMAVAYAAVANGGNVVRPRVGMAVGQPGEGETEEVLEELEPVVARELPLDDLELAMLREGLERVVSGANGTAVSAFAGFPLDQYPIAGKTGTAQLGETGKNYAWFISYGPADAAEYVISVYVDRAGHGGESAAPIARQIWEGIFGLDEETSVRLGQDSSG